MPDLNNACLSQDSKDNLIEKSKELFFTYLAINKLSKLANDNPAELTANLLNLGGTLDPSGEYIDFGPQADATPVEVKDLVLYTNEDYLKILAGTRWKISQQDGKYKFATTIASQEGKSYSIGGADKIDLYELHIHNLGKTIKHLSSDQSDENMLISMTTGSGKTFTQSLMVMAQYLSGIHGVFVLPNDVLLKQFKSDIQTLMPQEMYEDMITKDPSTQEEAIKLGTVE